MSLLEKIEELLKAEKQEGSTEVVQRENNDSNTQNLIELESQRLAELERQNKDLQKQITDLQKINREMLNASSVPESGMSFSEIMREQPFHPLKQKGE